MRPADRAVLDSRIKIYEQQNPSVDVRALYKETEELRSGLESAVLVGAGPDIVYGPWDTMGVYNEIGAVQDMTPWFPPEVQREFDPRTLAILPDKQDPSHRKLVFVGDRFGNHLALVYNRNLLKNRRKPPTNSSLPRRKTRSTKRATGGPIVMASFGTTPNRFSLSLFSPATVLGFLRMTKRAMVVRQ